MKSEKIRAFCFDGDVCEVAFIYDEKTGKHFGIYPDFEEFPRYTQSGWMWVGAINEGCPHGNNRFKKEDKCFDCGSCAHFLQELPGDLIGICTNEKMRKNGQQ